MAFRVIDIQATPNPNALKFILDGSVSDQPVSFLRPEEGRDHPLASRLFAIQGVSSLLLLGDFITVNKTEPMQWGQITPKVKQVLASG